LCQPSCCRHPVAHCNCFDIPLPITPQLHIPTAAVHCNFAAAVYCDCCCHPSYVASHFTASALVLASALALALALELVLASALVALALAMVLQCLWDGGLHEQETHPVLLGCQQ
jgi:hypothetical protein